MSLILPFGEHIPVIDETAWVAPNATLIGQVRLAPHSSVFYGAVLRGDRDLISIGEGSNLQDNVVIHCDPGLTMSIGAGVSVGHSAVLHGCIVENDCLIGMHATIMNRAVIGAESLVAAGALVLEDTVIPPRSLVAGVPAKVRRQLTDDEVAGLHQNAAGYVQVMEEHRKLRAL